MLSLPKLLCFAVLIFISEPVLALSIENSAPECQDAEVEIDGVPYLDSIESFNLGVELIKLSKIFCNSGDGKYSRFSLDIKVKIVGSDRVCGYVSAEDKLDLKLGINHFWNIADLTLCLVSTIEHQSYLLSEKGLPGICSMSKLAGISAEKYGELFNLFKKLYPTEESSHRRFSWHAVRMQTGRLELEAMCAFSKEPRPVRPPKTQEI